VLAASLRNPAFEIPSPVSDRTADLYIRKIVSTDASPNRKRRRSDIERRRCLPLIEQNGISEMIEGYFLSNGIHIRTVTVRKGTVRIRK
jgi:hypothetical protein